MGRQRRSKVSALFPKSMLFQSNYMYVFLRFPKYVVHIIYGPYTCSNIDHLERNGQKDSKIGKS